jgi:hypothetical protein
MADPSLPSSAPGSKSETTPPAPDAPATEEYLKSNGHRATIKQADTDDEHTGDEAVGPVPEVIDDDEDLLDDYPADVEELDLIHLRIKSISALKLERFQKIQVRVGTPPFPRSMLTTRGRCRNYASDKTVSPRLRASRRLRTR